MNDGEKHLLARKLKFICLAPFYMIFLARIFDFAFLNFNFEEVEPHTLARYLISASNT